MSNKISITAVVISIIAVLVAGMALVGGNNQSDGFQAGASTPGTRYPNGLTIGKPLYSPTNLALVQAGTCSLVSDTSITATSTGTGTCATTGSLAGDIVMVQLATTSTAATRQWVVTGTVAGTDSTTVRLLNLTGGALVPSSVSGLGSSTQFQVFRAQ